MGEERVLTTLVAVISIVVAVVGFIINLIAIGIYIGKLEGFKDLVNYKFDEQDKKLEKHNNFITRLYEVERKQGIDEKEIEVVNHRIKDLEKGEHHEKGCNSLDCRCKPAQ